MKNEISSIKDLKRYKNKVNYNISDGDDYEIVPNKLINGLVNRY